MSNLSAFPYIAERSEGTPGLWNYPLSIISANIAELDSGLTSSSPSGNTFSFLTNIETSGGAHFQFLSVGSTPPSAVTTAAITVRVNSAYSDYLYFVDSSAQKSSYVIGSRAGGLSDGLNIWDASAGTMIASFSKQSIRFFQNVVGPVFDVGGALAGTYNAATFGDGSQSIESRIQAAISRATIDGIARVYVPANMYPYSAASVSFDTRTQMVREGGNWGVYDVLAYGADPTATRDSYVAIQSALSNTAPTVADGRQGEVYVPTGIYSTSSTIIVPSKVRMSGTGRSGSVIRAAATFPASSPVVRLGPDGTLAFGTRLENMKIECSNITGSIGAYSTDIQEQSGLIGCTVTQYRDAGLEFDNTATESAAVLVHNCEFYGSALGSTVGLRLQGGITNFRVDHVTANGDSASPCADGILLRRGVLIATSVHFEQCTDGIDFDTPAGFGAHGLVLGATGDPSVTNLVHIHAAGAAGAGGVDLFGLWDNSATVTVLDDETGRTLTGRVAWYCHAEGPSTGAAHIVLSSEQDSGGMASPTALAVGNNDDYVFAGVNNSAKLRTARITANAGGSIITGIGAGVHARPIRIHNVGAGNLTIAHQNAGSVAANRILSPTGADITLATNGLADLQYDATTTRWRIVNVLA